MMRALAHVSALSVVLLAGCPPARLDVPCGASADCLELGDGVCLAVESGQQWCTYPDGACESGRRFSDFDVDPTYSGECVPVEAEPPVEPPVGRCNPQAPFGVPTLVPNINSSLSEFQFALTPDEKTVFIARLIDPNTQVILMSERPSTDVDFPEPVQSPQLAAINALGGSKSNPHPGSDDLALYFYLFTGNSETSALHVASRVSRASAFNSPMRIMVNGPTPPLQAIIGISPDGRLLHASDNQGRSLTLARRFNVEQFEAPTSLASFSLHAISYDGLTAYYQTSGSYDISVSSRERLDAPFAMGIPVENVNSTDLEMPIFVSGDGCFLYLSSNRPGGKGGSDIWVARRGL